MSRYAEPKVIAFASDKGGVGKSAAAVNMSAALATSHGRTLLVDLDHQADATRWVGFEGESLALAEVLVDSGDLSGAVVPTEVPGLDLIPSSGEWLSRAKRELAGKKGSELIFRGAFQRLLEQNPGTWQWIVLDTHPDVTGVLTLNALVAARDIICPVDSAEQALDGLVSVVKTMWSLQKTANPHLGIRAAMLAMKQRTRLARSIETELKSKFEDRALPSIRHRVHIAESYSERKPVMLAYPDCDSVEDYEAATAALVATYSSVGSGAVKDERKRAAG